jgi:hypothetical protein
MQKYNFFLKYAVIWKNIFHKKTMIKKFLLPLQSVNRNAMRYLFLFFTLLFFSTVGAQTYIDADRLFAAKKYAEAAEIYEHLYHYGKAVASYKKIIENTPKKRQAAETERLLPAIERAEKLERLVQRCENVQIIDSVIMDKNNFLNAYLLSDETGSILQDGENTVYENELCDRRFFGSSVDGKPSRIFMQDKILSEWAAPKQINLATDSLCSDSYPFVLSDGMTLYFASTGNGSIGGYDIFVSRYNTNSDSYLAPAPLGMPFNSIYNDYLYAVDETCGVGYFATDRFQPEDRVVIYTFIPNESYIPIENAEPDFMAERAKISSIKDSWREGEDYAAVLENIKKKIENRPAAVIKDFIFVINDNIVYYSLNDFESDAAKRTFSTVKSLSNDINTVEQNIDNWRKEYAIADQTKRRSLSESILAAESQLDKLYLSRREKIKETRNLEIRFLRNKK